MLGIRLALATIALAGCAWFALGIRSHHDQQAVSNLVNRPSGVLSPQQESHALHQLDNAAVLNPDGEVDILRAHVFIDAGDPVRAKRVLSDLLAREPKNLDGWILMYFTPPPHNPDSRLAAQRVNELVPPVPAGH